MTGIENETKSNELMMDLSKFLNTHDQNPNDSLFHYTSYEGLSGILKTRQFWLTDHKHLNDPSEIQHGKKIILKFIREHLQNNPEVLKHFLYRILDIIDNAYVCFTISFCEKGDYLPAWRYYGGDGAGFSIGFKKEYFFPKTPSSLQEEENVLLFFKVEYEENDSDLIRRIFGRINKIHPNWTQKNYNEINGFLTAITCNIITILPCIKNIDYKDEHEWRLCVTRLYSKKSDTWIPSSLPKDRLFISRRNLSFVPPFLKNLNREIPRFKSQEFSYKDIDCIYVGPRLDFDAAKLAIEKILLESGATQEECNNICIKKSDRAYQ